MAKPKPITVSKPESGDGVQKLASDIVSHGKATGHGINDIIAEIAWQWFRNSHHG